MNSTAIKKRPEKIKIKFSKNEFLIFQRVIHNIFDGVAPFNHNKDDVLELALQYELTRLHQKLAKLMIPVKEKYSISFSITECCIIFNLIDEFNLQTSSTPLVKVLFIRINEQIHKEVIV